MKEMTSKQRLLAAIRGEEVDHVPFSPFLAYYFDFLPESVRKRGELAHLLEMGADPLLRGGICAYESHLVNCSFHQKIEGKKRYETIVTPKGNLYSEYTYVAQANTWFLTKHPVSGSAELPAAIAYFEDLQVTEKIHEANEQIRLLGEQGLYLAILGTHMKSAYQYLLENLVGTENLIYLTMDDPDGLEELLSVMRKKNLETVMMTAKSEVGGCISWEDSSTTNVSPSLYQNYIAPEISQWCSLLWEAGKPYVQHACGHIKDLLIPMAKQGICGIESISPAPTGNVSIEEAFLTLPEQVSLIGGIEPTQILNDPIDSLLEYSHRLIQAKGKRGFILANSDSCPPGVEFEKFAALARLVKG